MCGPLAYRVLVLADRSISNWLSAEYRTTSQYKGIVIEYNHEKLSNHIANGNTFDNPYNYEIEITFRDYPDAASTFTGWVTFNFAPDCIIAEPANISDLRSIQATYRIDTIAW